MSKPTHTHCPSRHNTGILEILLGAALLCFCGVAFSQEKADLDAANRIRDAALNHSQIMEMVGYLTDVTGPRLTGSPNLKKAEEYARDKSAIPNMKNLVDVQKHPSFDPHRDYTLPWQSGMTGIAYNDTLTDPVLSLSDLLENPKLKGKIVLFSPARNVDPLFDPPAHRQTDEELLGLANAEPSADPPPFQFTAEQGAVEELNYRKWQLIQSEGAAVVLQPSFRDAGTVYVTSSTVPYPPDVPFEKRVQAWDISKPVVIPQAIVAAEQYDRIIRLVARGIPVRLEVNISVRFYDDDPMSYNVIAEIPGTDLKDEVVMLGASLDSWHAGTGATDNAVGAATALEVTRILQSLGSKPRRTIRIGLWSAEEQGTRGSHAYVATHLGRRIDPPDGQPGHARFGQTRVRKVRCLPQFRLRDWPNSWSVLTRQ